jgi:hypothetical protein
MTDRADVTAALQALAVQQAALVEAQAESVRIQRVLFERLLNETTASSGGNDRAVQQAAISDRPVSDVVVITKSDGALPSADIPPPPSTAVDRAILPAPADDFVLQDVAAPPSQSPLVQSPHAAPSTPRSSRGRASRYFNTHPTRPAKVVTRHDLALLRGFADIGAAGRFVLQFGPHRGATLVQIARSDPAYIRSLATNAQRPNVRAAALRLVDVLEDAEDAKKAKSNRRVRVS